MLQNAWMESKGLDDILPHAKGDLNLRILRMFEGIFFFFFFFAWRGNIVVDKYWCQYCGTKIELTLLYFRDFQYCQN